MYSRHTFRALGSPCALHLHVPTEAEAAIALAAALAELERIEGKFSRYRDDSLVSEINRAGEAGAAIELDDETSALIDFAFACHERSDGLFDITSGVLRRVWRGPGAALPDPEAVEALLARVGLWRLDWKRPRLAFRRPGVEIDLGGIGKEFAADRAATVLRELGVEAALIDLGGDLVATGPPPGAEGWDIALLDPASGAPGQVRVALRAGGLATSGDYARCVEIDGRRYGHILDPRTGWPVHGLTSVSVLGATGMVAGALATIGMLKGEGGAAWLASTGLPHHWVDAEGRQGGAFVRRFG